MKDIIFLLIHLLSTIAKLLQPGGRKTVIAENLLLKQQLIIHTRSRQRAPNLSAQDRVLLGFWSLFLNPRRIAHSAIIIQPSTLLRFHAALRKRKYSQLYSPRGRRKPGPKGPSKEIINAIVEMKQRNTRFGCPRIAQQINQAFDLEIDKDTVRRILATHYRPDPGTRGPSWLTTIGHAKDSLWSVDLFRCESIILKSQWVMVVMDQYTRRIIGFAVHAGNVDGQALCRMFNNATSEHSWPKYISSDNDPLFRYHRWKANLRVLEVGEIKSLPHHIRSLNDRLAASGVSYSITLSSGLRLTWRTSFETISAITTRASVGSNFLPAIQSVVDWTSKPETSECSRALSCLHLFQHSLHLGMHHIDSL